MKSGRCKTSSPQFYLVEIGQWFLLCYEHLGKLHPFVSVDPHDIAKQEHVVRSVVDLLGIQDDLLELPSLCIALDHLHRHIHTFRVVSVRGCLGYAEKLSPGHGAKSSSACKNEAY